jgi:hypothetical protein
MTLQHGEKSETSFEMLKDSYKVKSPLHIGHFFGSRESQQILQV